MPQHDSDNEAPDALGDSDRPDALSYSERPDALVDRVRALAAAASVPRILIGITGSPGSGKTTLARELVHRLVVSGTEAAHLPMDGFHLANSTLDRLGIRDRKGAIDTFDGWGFVALLERVRAETGHTVYAPRFDRAVDEPVAGAIAIEPTERIIVVEGNYLLADIDPWNGVGERLDEVWFCATAEDERMRRLIDRHIRQGRSPAAARAWATDVDGANALLIEPTRERADLVVSHALPVGDAGSEAAGGSRQEAAPSATPSTRLAPRSRLQEGPVNRPA
ncbi:nucleoside/nucleotide kinase family protein [Glaciibacter flavus]|uniref:nucleoside/nucleotide kinase family protein n=1 Tax=Orlajensenia flava TaxID=2565934 RepID=UPI003B00A772